MSILSELVTIVEGMSLPVETGTFSTTPPDSYVVLTPLVDVFEGYADDLPQLDVQEVRISYFSRFNYVLPKKQLVNSLIEAGFIVTDRRYLGFDEETKYHQLAIDVAKPYLF